MLAATKDSSSGTSRWYTCNLTLPFTTLLFGDWKSLKVCLFKRTHYTTNIYSQGTVERDSPHALWDWVLTWVLQALTCSLAWLQPQWAWTEDDITQLVSEVKARTPLQICACTSQGRLYLPRKACDKRWWEEETGLREATEGGFIIFHLVCSWNTCLHTPTQISKSGKG